MNEIAQAIGSGAAIGSLIFPVTYFSVKKSWDLKFTNWEILFAYLASIPAIGLFGMSLESMVSRDYADVLRTVFIPIPVCLLLIYVLKIFSNAKRLAVFSIITLMSILTFALASRMSAPEVTSGRDDEASKLAISDMIKKEEIFESCVSNFKTRISPTYTKKNRFEEPLGFFILEGIGQDPSIFAGTRTDNEKHFKRAEISSYKVNDDFFAESAPKLTPSGSYRYSITGQVVDKLNLLYKFDIFCVAHPTANGGYAIIFSQT